MLCWEGTEGAAKAVSGALTCFPTDFYLFLLLHIELVTVTGLKLMLLDVTKLLVNSYI